MSKVRASQESMRSRANLTGLKAKPHVKLLQPCTASAALWTSEKTRHAKLTACQPLLGKCPTRTDSLWLSEHPGSRMIPRVMGEPGLPFIRDVRISNNYIAKEDDLFAQMKLFPNYGYNPCFYSYPLMALSIPLSWSEKWAIAKLAFKICNRDTGVASLPRRQVYQAQLYTLSSNQICIALFTQTMIWMALPWVMQ